MCAALNGAQPRRRLLHRWENPKFWESLARVAQDATSPRLPPRMGHALVMMISFQSAPHWSNSRVSGHVRAAFRFPSADRDYKRRSECRRPVAQNSPAAELDASPECDHPRRTIAAETYFEQAGGSGEVVYANATEIRPASIAFRRIRDATFRPVTPSSICGVNRLGPKMKMGFVPNAK